MAENNVANMMTDTMKVYKALFFDLPVAGIRQGLGLADDQETTTSAWGGYDAMVRLSSQGIDNLYRTPQFAEATARTLDGFLRWQQVSNALTRTVLTGLTQAAGLPSANETRALQAEIRALREEVTALRGVPERTEVSPKVEQAATPIKRVAA